jgi:hypothetical protein
VTSIYRYSLFYYYVGGTKYSNLNIDFQKDDDDDDDDDDDIMIPFSSPPDV